MKAKELIDRYVYDVTRRLPQEQRADIEKELGSLIDDMLAARTGEAEASADDVTAVLKELGRPSELAAKYRGTKRHLIGPDYYDLYMLVLKIVLAATGFGLVIALIVGSLATLPENAFSTAAQSFWGIISGLFQAFAYVTIAFALTERFSKKLPESFEWNPKDLPPVPSMNKKDTLIIKRGDPIAGLVFGVIGLVIFNAMPWIFGFVTGAEGLVSIPIFNLDVLLSLLPLINLSLCLSMLKDVIRLIAGRYTMKVSISLAIINAALIVLAIVVFLPPAIWNANFMSSLHTATGAAFFAEPLANTFWTNLPTIIVVLSVFGYVVDSIVTIYRGARGSAMFEKAA